MLAGSPTTALVHFGHHGRVTKPLILALALAVASTILSAPKNSPWQPSPGQIQIPIWPGTPPDAQPGPDLETSDPVTDLVAGKPWVEVRNVSRPTMTVYSPK